MLNSSSYLEAFLPPWIVIWELVPPCHGGGIQCEIVSWLLLKYDLEMPFEFGMLIQH
ncbi:hypothetical protein T12_4612 [Trichinella patagoniensis]|uniref:Uncharacterized protein n=1 Tax=Trichinella patagoniensis TaxID=990121 RepID=A0A0V1A483_9BILA|nr:hypothetical protein T12_4612 [Trichinella patagoniensis]